MRRRPDARHRPAAGCCSHDHGDRRVLGLRTGQLRRRARRLARANGRLCGVAGGRFWPFSHARTLGLGWTPLQRSEAGHQSSPPAWIDPLRPSEPVEQAGQASYQSRSGDLARTTALEPPDAGPSASPPSPGRRRVAPIGAWPRARRRAADSSDPAPR